MSTQAPETKVRPSAAWYLLVAALWIGAAVLAVITVVPIIKVFSSDLQTVDNAQTIQVPDDGLTVYTTASVNSTTCSFVDAQGNATPLDPFDEGDNVDFDPANGPHVYALGVTPDNFPAGAYTLECSRLAGGTLATGKRIDFVEIGTRFLVGFGGGGLLGLIGLIVLIVLLVKRHNSKSRIRQYQAAGAYGAYPTSYGTYGSPPDAGGGYPPGSYPPPSSGYPPPGGNYPPTYPPPAGGSTPPPPPAAHPPADDTSSGSSKPDEEPPRS